jgi:hypothetical protein
MTTIEELRKHLLDFHNHNIPLTDQSHDRLEVAEYKAERGVDPKSNDARTTARTILPAQADVDHTERRLHADRDDESNFRSTTERAQSNGMLKPQLGKLC